MAIGERCQVVASGTFQSGDIWQNVWHIEYDSSFSPIDSTAAGVIAAKFEDFYTSVALDFWSSKTELVSVSVQDMNAEGLIPWEFAMAVTGPAVDTIPQILACVLTLRNSTSGLPSHRGRIFIPMTGVDALGASGFVIASALLTLTDAAAQLGFDLNDVTDSDGLTIFSRKFSTNTPCDQVVADNYAAVIRGRQDSVLKTKLVNAVPYGT